MDSLHESSVMGGILYPPPEHQPLISQARLKASPHDFFVDEIPKYAPCGDGEHLFVQLRKTNIGSTELLTTLQSKLELEERDIGMAGQKDRRAVTQQWISVPKECDDKLQQFEAEGIEILQVQAHTNKLRTGHLAGNIFRIRLTDVVWGDSQFSDVGDRMQHIESHGFPNYFGPQRFGIDGRNIKKGLIALKATGKKKRLKRFLISAAQSAVFNLVLAGRVQDTNLRTVLPGDIVCSAGGIKPFPAPEQANWPDYVPMGPLPGGKCLSAKDNANRYEKNAFEQLGLTERIFKENGKRCPGARRSMIAFASSCQVVPVEDDANSCIFEFRLPPGSFATTLLNEIVGNLLTRN